MKKIAIGLLLAVIVLGCATAQQVFYKTEATVLWDAVTLDAQGNPLMPTDSISYQVYLYDDTIGVVDDQNPSLLINYGSAAVTEMLMIFPYRTIWNVGVRAVLTDGGGNISYSPTISWSYDAAVADPVAGPFVYSPLGLPEAPEGLQDSGT